MHKVVIASVNWMRCSIAFQHTVVYARCRAAFLQNSSSLTVIFGREGDFVVGKALHVWRMRPNAWRVCRADSPVDHLGCNSSREHAAFD